MKFRNTGNTEKRVECSKEIQRRFEIGNLQILFLDVLEKNCRNL